MQSNESHNRLIDKITRELGEIVNIALNDDAVLEIMLNPDGVIWVERFGEDMKKAGTMFPSVAKSVISTVASMLGTNITIENPILECQLPIDGSRFEALLPPIVANPTFTIRKKAKKIFTLEDYVSAKILSNTQKNILEDSIRERKNILVVGGTGSGKTTLTNAIIDSIVKINPDHRIVIIEDTAEIQCAAENNVILCTSKDVTMLQLLKATMRLRPDRILVGEVRDGAALDLIDAWNTGHPGGVATIHANSASAGLSRMERLVARVTSAEMEHDIAEAVNVVVYIGKTTTVSRREIKEIIEVIGYDPIAKKYIFKEIM